MEHTRRDHLLLFVHAVYAAMRVRFLHNRYASLLACTQER